ncbi:Rad52/Rad22 family DNA repair protein [Pseudarthrobacter sp. ATCC 49987]|uniref:Rad52/Rad22 family DNA repair protein n=1 Tax=Pseudarthrobacter sp. ATCC 49987 TaxID=2698204 RepID=UPI00136FC924|nr:Rad52/Rad22 family DNA repair protein [Pseudarthrobacter sp. ATCC 49987]
MSKVATFDLKALRAPFKPEDIEWRVQRSGVKGQSGWVQVIAYIDNRAVQNRLDDVVGPENWRDQFDTSPNGGILCGLSIRVNGEWITKWDGADNSDIEPIKGGLSNAMKRAAVQWGIGRYLYSLEAVYQSVYQSEGENYIQIWKNPKNKQGDPDVKGYWNPPKLPNWALPIRAPGDEKKAPPASALITGTAPASEPAIDNPPSGAQIIKIKTLYNAIKADPNKRDKWLAAILTDVQAAQAIERLEAKKQEMEEV